MYKFYFRAGLLLIVLFFSWTVYAAGLGKLTLNSALGQPFEAEIDLVAVKNDEISTLTAGLASHEAFRQAGITYQSFFSTLEISIEPRLNGDSYIKITSPQLINEPFLNMLVELRWAAGRLMREYTVLLDPVESKTPEPVASAIMPVAAEKRSNESEESASSNMEKAQAQSFSVIDSVSNNQSEATYGPVNQGDTLSRIAAQISPQDVHLDQMLIALFRANHGAFIGNNINLLKVGEILRIPSSSEIKEISESEVNAQIKAQITEWHNYQRKHAVISNEQPEREVLAQYVGADQITTTVADEETVASKKQPEEMLRLSSGEYIDEVPGDYNTGRSPHDRIQMIEEDSIARSLAIIEANERIEVLENNIQNLQRLLELKDPVLAQAQIQAETLLEPESIKELTSTSTEAISPSSVPAAEIIDEKLTKSPQPVITGLATTPDSLQAFEEDVSPQSQPSFILKYIEYIGGILVLLLVGILAMSKMRRNKAENEIDSDEMNFGVPSSFHHRMASMTAVNSLTPHEANDVADDMSATESNLRHEIETNAPDDVQDNLREIDLDFSQDEKASEVAFDDGQNMTSDSLHDSEDLPEETVASDYEIDFDLNDLAKNANQVEYKEWGEAREEVEIDGAISLVDPEISANENRVTEQNLSIDLDVAETLPESSGVIKQLAPSANEIDYVFDLDSENSTDENSFSKVVDKSTTTEGTEKETDEDNSLFSYSLDVPVEGSSMEQPVSSEQESQNEAEKFDLSIDFTDNSESSAAFSATPKDSASATEPEIAVTTNLESEPDESSISSVHDAAIEEQSEQWHGVETKIDLAKAYIEMDDNEGAKEILEEVISEGDPQQREKAREMLGHL